MTSTRDWSLPDYFKPCALPSAQPLASWWTRYAHSRFSDLNGDTALPSSTTHPVAIIGSGMTGISTALQLVRTLPANSSVVVLEARSFCSGATGRNGGHLATQSKYFSQDVADKHGRQDALAADKLESRTERWLLDMAHEHGWARECLLNEGGDAIFFDSEQERLDFESGVEHARQLGLDTSEFKYYTSEACEREWQVKAPFGAYWHQAANFFPLRFVSRLYELALAEAKKRHVSLDLYTHAPVTAVRSSESGTWTLDINARGSVRSKAVIHATNAYASHLLPSYARGSQRIVPTRGQVSSFTRASSNEDKQRWDVGLAAGGDGNYYMFETLPDALTHTGPRVILGGGRLFAEPGLEWGVSDDTSVHPAVSTGTAKWLSEFAPGRKWEREMEWTGIMAFTATHAPFVGPAYEGSDKLNGQFIAAGFNGHGMPRCASAAEAVASMTVAYLTKETWSKPEWLPEFYLTRPHEVASDQATLVGDDAATELKAGDTEWGEKQKQEQSKTCCLVK